MFNHIKIYASLMLISFATISCMESDPAPSDIVLQKLIQRSNSLSLCMVKMFREHTEQQGKTLTSAHIGPLLDLDKSAVNQLFLDNLDDDEMRRFVWSMGPDINSVEKGKRSCLFYTKKPAALEDLISWGADVNGVNEQNQTPLYFHCAEKHTDVPRNEIARVLLKAGAHTHTPEKKYYSLLYLAIRQYDEEFTDLLCEHKANVNEVGSLGTSLLEHAIYTDLAGLVASLLNYGASADSPNDRHEYPIHKAICYNKFLSYHEQPKQPVPAIVLLLLQSGANPNRPYPDTDGKKMPLHRAVELNALSVVKALLDYKASPLCCDERGYTPLALAKKLAEERLGWFQGIIALLTPVTPLEIPEEISIPNSNQNQTVEQSSDELSSEEPQIDDYLSVGRSSRDEDQGCSIS